MGNTSYVDIVLPLALPRPFTYAVAAEDVALLQRGMRVAVPFGKQKIYTGIVYALDVPAPQRYTAKYIEVLLEEEPAITARQLALWEWIASYYQCSLGEILRAAIPSVLLLESELLMHLHPECPPIDSLQLTDAEYLILEALQVQPLKVQQITEIVQRKQVLPLLHRMVAKGWIEQQQQLQEKYRPKKVRRVRLHPKFQQAQQLQELFDQLQRAPKQSQFLLALLENNPTGTWKKVAVLTKKSGSTSAVVRSLIDKSILEEAYQAEDRQLFEQLPEKAQFALSKAQKEALHDIDKQLKTKDVILLEGVTASGKTVVFSKKIEACLNNGQQVLYLLPEIALTQQMVQRLQVLFSNQVTVYHSKYSGQERTEVWHAVRTGASNAQLIVGARSALFLPFKNLGLIVVDEEHETSYKQFDPAPRYHARDTAIVLGKQHQVPVLLGSATPALETAYNARTGKYGWVQLHYRYSGVTLPKIETIDLKEAHRKKQMEGMFSKTLRDALSACMAEGHQAILFQNRRGFAPVMECHSCGHTPECTQCDVTLTYHKKSQQLKCHYCGYSIPAPVQCHACGMPTLNLRGSGTQQIEAQLHSLFPEAQVGRMDWDTTRGKRGFDHLLQAFSNQELQILVGTQMLIKGLDFKNVQLVGVMHADQLMFQPNFRAMEQSFQMLSQVAGRAGRAQKQGTVFFQTYQPHHPLFQYVKDHNFEAFYQKELQERKQFAYPPFYRVLQITLKHRNLATLDQAALWWSNVLKQSYTGPLLGPVAPPVGRIRNQYIKQLRIKTHNASAREQVKQLIAATKKSFEAIGSFRAVRLSIDVDSYQ